MKTNKDAREALEALERLANTPMQISLSDWNDICSKIRAALQTPSYEALRKSHAELLEALERSRTVIQKFVDCGLGGMDAALALDEINLIFMQLDEKLQEGK